MNKEQLPKEFCIRITNREEGADLIEKLEQLYNLQTNLSGSSLDYYYGIQNDQIRRYGESFGTEYTYSQFQELITSPKELTELPERWCINLNVSKEDKYWFIEQNKKVGGRLGFNMMCDYYIMTNEFRYENISTDKPNYPELTILQLKQYFNKMEEKQEKWVECVDNDNYTKNLTIGKKYKIEGKSYEYYYITNDSGIKSAGGYLKRRFKEINNMEKEEINNMEKEEIIRYSLKNKKYQKAVAELINSVCTYKDGQQLCLLTNSGSIEILKEAGILDLWFEPVYKSKETILQIGSPSKKVTISKGKIEVEGYKVSVHSLHSIIKAHKTEVGSWTVKDIKFQIGCSWFELNEIQKVIDAYNL